MQRLTLYSLLTVAAVVLGAPIQADAYTEAEASRTAATVAQRPPEKASRKASQIVSPRRHLRMLRSRQD